MISLASRQRCLDELGVVQWYARCRLPGAAQAAIVMLPTSSDNPETSRLFDRSAGDDPERIELSDLGASEPEAVYVSTLSKELPSLHCMVETLQNTDSEVPVSPDSLGYAAVPDHQTMKFGLYRVGSIVVVTDHQADMWLSASLDLLGNILKSSGADDSGCTFLQSFTWPVFQSSDLLVTDNVSKEKLLTRWLSSFISEDIQIMLQFGLTGRDFVKEFANSQALKFVGFEYSLADLLADPRRKSATWNTLSENRSFLKTSASQ